MSNCLLFKTSNCDNPLLYINNSDIYLSNHYFAPSPSPNYFPLNSNGHLPPVYGSNPYGRVEIILIAILILTCLDLIFVRPLKMTANITQNSS